MCIAQESALESNKLWQKNIPHLYNTMVQTALVWPSLTCQWFPSSFAPATPLHTSFNASSSYLLLGTHASDNEPNYLMVANVTLRENASSAHTVQTCQQIFVDSEINRARTMPQLPSLVACVLNMADIDLSGVCPWFSDMEAKPVPLFAYAAGARRAAPIF